MTEDPFWSDRFHWCALAAGLLAAAEGRLADSGYVKQLAYLLFEEGAFAGRVPQPAGAAARNSLVCLTGAAVGACCDATQGPRGGATTKAEDEMNQRTDNPVNAGR